ncbi:lysophosphatidylcholine acyltransferase 2-like isoform X1 [Centruroides sculpturatus]|uniref:lysophosphatidylcholine acyltransferase 2-like isoform X1 n=2 Tax=Centruroides sculpturatus TaxID=218467 RepID=UPI000C6EA127|nr:lysophosphatidylcholine acyltransferase 2-like isoform X1 [Centruroides sculpturatus]
MTFTIFPIRFIIMIILLMTAWLLTSIGFIGLSEKEFQEKPMSGWRKFIKECERRLGHIFFFMAGFQNIKILGKKAHSSEAPILCVAPHSTFFDTLMEFIGGVYCPVVREQSSSTAIVSTLITYTQPVYVKRDDPLSRQHTIQEIRRRALSGDDWEQILIFPEGTCTNRTCLIHFKSGAFLPGVPVQPVCIRYLNKPDTVTWTWDGPGAWKVIWLTMTQLHQPCEIEFLPVYTPSEEEKQDPRLYADNIRNIMAKKLCVPTCDLSYDDIKYQVWAKERHLLHTVGVTKLLKLRRKLNLEKKSIKEEIANSENKLSLYNNLITCKEFANFLTEPVSEVIRDFFDAFDPNRSGLIDLRSYIAGLWLIRQDIDDDEKLENAFKVFCSGVNYSLGVSEFERYMWLIKGISSSWSEKIFKKLSKDGETLVFDDLQSILFDNKYISNGAPQTNGSVSLPDDRIISDSVLKTNCNQDEKKRK